MEQLLDVGDIALALKLSRAHVRDRLVKLPNFPLPYLIGGARRWKKEDLEDWIEGQQIRKVGRPRKSH